MRIMRVEVITREPVPPIDYLEPYICSEPQDAMAPKRVAYKKAATAPMIAIMAAPEVAAAPVNWEGAGLVLEGAPVAAGWVGAVPFTEG
jgi:hypothetical protein